MGLAQGIWCLVSSAECRSCLVRRETSSLSVTIDLPDWDWPWSIGLLVYWSIGLLGRCEWDLVRLSPFVMWRSWGMGVVVIYKAGKCICTNFSMLQPDTSTKIPYTGSDKGINYPTTGMINETKSPCGREF